MNNKKTIIFYAPFGKGLLPHKIGGAENGCIKTETILIKAGYTVIRMDKPTRSSFFRYIVELILTWYKVFVLLKRNKQAILHVAGFYGKIIVIEYIFLFTAKLMKRQSVYEIRNGNFINEYNKRSVLYKKIVASIVKNATVVLCQGKIYVDFIKEKLHQKTYYYPNYVLDSLMENTWTSRDMHKLKMVFFGRITPSKNIIFMINVCDELTKLGLDISLDLIGGYTEEYKKEIDVKINDFLIPAGVINIRKRINSDELYLMLKQYHFFLFPSKEKGEGHSNALTEAMSCGVVPVVSRAGFNASIVGDEKFVIQKYDAKDYAKMISSIWNSGKWENYSQWMFERVKSNFTETIVKNNLLSVYESI
jgi:glycosyltransferase involved in cell wall biosynthesis